MTGPRIGSLFSGYGGLDMGVQQVVGGSVAWHVEFADAPSKILKHHWPDVPNYGDITTVDWAAVEPVDVLTGGFPCQDVSLAGRRAGLTEGTRSGLWSEYARAIDILRPEMVVIENVQGLLSAEAAGAVEPDPWGLGDGPTRPTLNAFGVVLGDLAGLGYDTQWIGLRAADAGAPHGRFRVFVVAHCASERRGEGRAKPAGWLGRPSALVGRRTLEDAYFTVGGERGQPAPGQAESGRPRTNVGGRGGTPAPDTNQERRDGRSEEFAGRTVRPADARNPAVAWGDYEPAIRRWESVTGRLAPSPTNPDGRGGGHRLAASFVEWMMGLPAGHVTDPVIGLSRNDQLKALGNGVVPQQAALAVSYLLNQLEREFAA